MRRYSNSTPPLSAAPSLRIKKPCSQSCLNLVLALAIEIFALLCSANSAALALGRLSAYASASRFPGLGSPPTILIVLPSQIATGTPTRSEERSGGKEGFRTCRSRWPPYH